MQVEWHDLSVAYGQKQVLSKCSGSVRPGRMVALMGASGSGKTTLLTCLRQDIPHSGTVYYDGARFCKSLRHLIGHAEQDDVVIPQLTVRESFLFTAELRYGIGAPEALSKVNSVLALMRLEKVADTPIGTAGVSPRISGGERKRTCIGRELLAEPKFLITDEPTSGLDSTMANQVVQTMRELCDSGQVSLVSSIHQPSTHILETFDDVILLQEGEMIYFGPVLSVEALFVSYGPQRSPSQSMAEYLMDCLVLPSNHPQGMGDDARSSLKAIVCKQKELLLPPDASSINRPVHFTFHAPFRRQLALLLRRHYKLQKGVLFTRLSLVQNVVLMLTCSLLWLNLGFSERDIHPRHGMVLWTLGCWMFFPLFANMGTFQAHRDMLEKELKNGCYSLEAFFGARTLLLMPLGWLWPLFWSAGVYWMSNVNPALEVYVQFQLLVFVNFSVFEGVGQAISATDMPGPRAATLGITLISFWFGWSGFFMDLDRVPDTLSWLSHGNIFMYFIHLGIHILLTKDLNFSCEQAISHVYGSWTHCQHAGDKFSGLQAKRIIGVDRSWELCLCVVIPSLIVCRFLAFGFLRYNLHDVIDGSRRGNRCKDEGAIPCGTGKPSANQAETQVDIEHRAGKVSKECLDNEVCSNSRNCVVSV